MTLIFDPETAKSASTGGWFTDLPRLPNHLSAAGPPMRSDFVPPDGSVRIVAIRQRGTRKTVCPNLSRTGADTAGRTPGTTGRGGRSGAGGLAGSTGRREGGRRGDGARPG